MMTKRLAAVGLAAFLLSNQAAIAQREVNERRPAASDGTVKITNAVGSVTVRGWDRDTVAVSGKLGVGSERLELSVGERDTRIRVVVPRDALTNQGSELVVHVPRGSHVAVRTAAADVTISDVTGALDLESVSGQISASGRPRLVYAESAAGDVYIDVVAKAIRARSVGGNVTVLRALGYLQVSTVSGSARVEGNGLWEGEVSSVSGDILFAGDFDSGGSFHFESHSGTVQLTLPSNIAADFEITTFGNGGIENQFAPASERSFSTGGGGTQLSIKSFKGKLRILKKG